MTVFAAINDFVSDFMERHGQNEATRTEAHDRVRELEAIVTKTVAFCKDLGMTDDQPVTIALIASETRRDDEAERYLIEELIKEEMK